MRRRAGSSMGYTSLILVLLLMVLSAYAQRHKRILLDSIKTLTFYNGERTTARRSSSVPQLSCRGRACRSFEPDVIQCANMGDWQWKCEADLPEELRLGKVEVSCEGWDNADDPYVLSGNGSNSGFSFVSLLFWIIFLGILAIIVRGWYLSLTGRNPAVGTSYGSGPGGPGGGGGGWGWGGWGGGGWGPGSGPGPSGPPPPYSKDQATSGSADNNQTGWRPGFWTGLFAGVLGSGIVNPGARQRRGGAFYGDQYRAGNYFDDADDGRFGYGGGFRGGNIPRRSGGSVGGGSGSMRRSTGFGGTNNR
ncbi:hypothetical protein OC846_002929 [Tilletia horrida]|uniref:Store-operated calcium entry-associated regulatory factor n=1 Tax=Tilletia horrida TaxID=155126 RepID=A0AAN6GPX4_9BASI|nr:hypothetical protein OC846_002929 [Tilletia horrida]KAK0552990.1 hypothetical protein OC845_001409 [Tilletia horrida]KAK0566890.1 hypothetical protein OC861_003012 [Tilletia horrida]